jgi:hypothetical protein
VGKHPPTFSVTRSSASGRAWTPETAAGTDGKSSGAILGGEVGGRVGGVSEMLLFVGGAGLGLFVAGWSSLLALLA